MVTKQIKGQTVMVDDQDAHFLNLDGWNINANGYVCRFASVRGKKRSISLARLIIGLDKRRDEHGRSLFADHINGNRLDNRRENLRIVHGWLNALNRHRQPNNKSGCPGVHFEQGSWMVRIGVDYKQVYLGRYSTFEEAKAVREKYLQTVLESGEKRHTLTFPRFTQNKSGVVGVYFDDLRQRWVAMIRDTFLGAFDLKSQAIEARKEAELRDRDRKTLKGLCT